MYVYFLPYPLAVYGIVLADMLVSQRSPILYQITLDNGVIPKGPADGIQLDIRIQDDRRFRCGILDRSHRGRVTSSVLRSGRLLFAGGAYGPFLGGALGWRRLRVSSSCDKGEDQGQQA
jgi:hypothetical protein